MDLAEKVCINFKNYVHQFRNIIESIGIPQYELFRNITKCREHGRPRVKNVPESIVMR